MQKPTFYDEITKKYESLMVENLKSFVAIPSVYSEETKDENNPFGKDVSNALEFIKNLAIKDGFKATNYDNMVVEIIAGDESKKNITIMAHCDVVPAGSGWPHDPFDVREEDGVFYGRGVADDKGPLLSCYYGLLALKERGLLGDYCVRFLVGGNEESGSLGIEHYFHTLNKKQPDLGFSPDSDYPLTYGEKGIIGFESKLKVNIPEVISIHGGVAHNAVIESCFVLMKHDQNFLNYLEAHHIKYSVEVKGDVVEIEFKGKAAHGSKPWLGENAGLIAVYALGECYHHDELIFAYNCYAPTRGEGVRANAHNDEMFDNSLCVGFVDYEHGELRMTINFRYINGLTEEQMIETVIKNSEPMEVKVMGTSPLLYFPRDSVLISTLMHVYQEETGDYESKPLTSGGGTYAKEADNIVAFGMQFPGWDSRMHAIDEQVKRVDLVKSMAIYARAIVELGEKL